MQSDRILTVWVPSSLPPHCPLDLCQTREQIESRHGCVPKYSGKESKEHICCVEKRMEMPWCLKGHTVEIVQWYKAERHIVRWEVESRDINEVDGQIVEWRFVFSEDWLIWRLLIQEASMQCVKCDTWNLGENVTLGWRTPNRKHFWEDEAEDFSRWHDEASNIYVTISAIQLKTLWSYFYSLDMTR